MLLRDILNDIRPLSVTAIQKIEGITDEVKFPKGHVLLSTARIEPYLYFVKAGMVRAYVPDEEGERTFWFGIEGAVVLSMRSYVFDRASYENVMLVEPSEFYRIEINRLKALYDTDITVANWGRKLAEKELVKIEERVVAAHTKSASERYWQLVHESPFLIQRVPLGYIASYLGITQASLSRIRSER